MYPVVADKRLTRYKAKLDAVKKILEDKKPRTLFGQPGRTEGQCLLAEYHSLYAIVPYRHRRPMHNPSR